MKKIQIKSDGYAIALIWCQDNVGPWGHDRWVAYRMGDGSNNIEVKIFDEEKALEFALRFA